MFIYKVIEINNIMKINKNIKINNIMKIVVLFKNAAGITMI